jgi:hypothetical protein
MNKNETDDMERIRGVAKAIETLNTQISGIAEIFIVTVQLDDTMAVYTAGCVSHLEKAAYLLAQLWDSKRAEEPSSKAEHVH